MFIISHTRESHFFKYTEDVW